MTLLDFWPTAEAINACMPSEAEVISDAAFLAVHQPVRLLRGSLTNPDAAKEPADERAVLDALLTPQLPEGYVVVPIVGPSGVGKSHLVRWLGLHLTDERHVVVSIPKSTSLRRILEGILDQVGGGEYDDIRRRLATAHDTLDDIAAEEKLLTEFRIALRRKTDEAKKACVEAKLSGRTVPADRRAIAETHGDGLYALLEGPTKDALLNGSNGRSVFRSLVRRVRTGQIDAESAEFTPDDLNLDAVKLKVSDDKVKKYLGKLKANIQNERTTAAGLLNNVRDGAVGQLLGLGENQLADLFRRVREQLLEDGKELVLLIEDFTTLAGMQKGLLDVIKMEGVQKGKTVLCPLRTAMAVTEGFLSDYDTLTSRIGHEYILREHPAGEPELLNTITDLVGAYLNAARLGAARLEAWFDGTNRDPNAVPPSFEKAAEQLPEAARAALDAFGQSSRGHSLFPFNRAAVKQLARQHLTADGRLRLNPRALIKDVLHATLLHDRDTFARGQFPPDGFHSFNPNQLGPDVTRWVDAVRKADAPRYKVLLGFWGDRPKAKDDVRLSAGVYTAFGLTPLADAPATRQANDTPVLPPPPPAGVPQAEPTENEKLREKAAAREQVLDDWATTRKISQPDARGLRNDLLDMIGAAIDWDAELLAGTRDLTAKPGKVPKTEDEEEDDEEFEPVAGSPVERRFPPEKFRTAVASDRVYLPFTGSKTADADDACFVLCREEVFDSPAFSDVRLELRALVRFHTYRSFDYDGGDEDRGWYAGLAERATRQAREYIRKRYERVPDDEAATAAAAQALYVSARVLNLDGAHSAQDADVVAAVLHPGPGGLPPKPDDPWHGFRQACATNRITARDFLLRRLAARQGGGGVLHAIDAARLLKWIAPVRKSCRVEAEFPGTPTELDGNARQVREFVNAVGAKRTESAVNTRRDSLRQWAETTRTWLGSPFDKKAFVAECRGLLNQANQLNVFRGEVAIDTLRQHLKEFDEAAVGEAISAVDKLKDDATASVVLTAVVQAPDDAIRKADTFRTGFQRFVELTLAEARTRIGQKLQLAGGDATADPSTLLPAEGRKLDADLRAILAACGAQPAELPDAADVETTPATATGRFADLAAVLDRLSRVDTVAQQLKELESPRSAVNGWATDLPAFVAQHHLFISHGVSIDPPPVTTKVANAAEAARTAVARSPLDISKNRTFSNLKAAVEKVLEGYRTAVKSAWETWVDRTAPRVEEGELTPFEKHPDYEPVVGQIRTKRATLKRFRNESAETASDFQLVEETAAGLRQLLGQLPTEAPAEVKQFLTAAREGAALDLLTPAVLAWLRDNNQLDKYRIWR